MPLPLDVPQVVGGTVHRIEIKAYSHVIEKNLYLISWDGFDDAGKRVVRMETTELENEDLAQAFMDGHAEIVAMAADPDAMQAALDAGVGALFVILQNLLFEAIKSDRGFTGTVEL